ncbi:MAG: hypothetical protein JWP57_921 [Spirosoma sp.]|nr:hypothetical protein [Spirosoma sp.]
MSELDHNLPDDFWRKAFEEASEAPPSRVWDAVERRLDDNNDHKVLPLWGIGRASSRPVAWGIGVAAVIALLLVGQWVFWTTRANEPVVQHQPPIQERNVALSALKKTGKISAPKELPKGLSTPHEGVQADVAMNRRLTPQSPGNQRSAPAAPSSPAVALPAAQLTDQPGAESPVLPSIASMAEKEKVAREQQIPDAHPQQTLVSSAFRANVIQNNQMSVAGRQFSAGAATPLGGKETVLDAASKEPAAGETVPSFDPVSTLSIRIHELGAIQRIVWLPPAEPVTELATIHPKRNSREVWATVSMMPGAFNPSVTVRPAQASFASVNTLTNTSASQPSVSSRANFSVAYQAGAGIQLNDHWSVESGVGYLAGRSTVESPVQASALNNLSVGSSTLGQQANLYVDALRSSSAGASSAQHNTVASPATAVMDYIGVSNRITVQNTYSSQARQSLTNDYQFVQVPVQVGYQLRPRKRLGVALLGGFLSNIFVRNTVSDELVITNKDGVYRPISWAATLGARLRYRPSRQWSASLAGIYQPSLGFGTRPQSFVQSQPTSTGMSFGIDYHF